MENLVVNMNKYILLLLLLTSCIQEPKKYTYYGIVKDKEKIINKNSTHYRMYVRLNGTNITLVTHPNSEIYNQRNVGDEVYVTSEININNENK